MIGAFAEFKSVQALTCCLLICLIFAGTLSCTYKGSIRRDFSVPPPRQDQKAPLKVALLVDSRKQPPILHGTHGIFKYDIDLYPGLITAVVAQLTSIFKDVHLITDVRESGDANLVAHLELEVQNKTHEFPSRENEVPADVFYTRLELSFQDVSSKQRVSSYDSSQTFSIGMDNSAHGTMYALVFSFGLASPITLPLGTRFQGGYATGIVEEKLAQMIGTISDKIIHDQNRILVRLATILDSTEPLDAQTDESETGIGGLWHIDDLKKGVVRVTAHFDGIQRTGTGFIVWLNKHAAYIVTAAHVVEGDPKPQVTFFTDSVHSYPAKVIGIEGDDRKGLAALFVEGQFPSGLRRLSLETTVQVTGGEQVTLIGFPQPVAIPWTVTNGNVSGLKGRELTFQAPVEEGNSGGPLLLNSKVVGVVVEGRGQFGYAVPTPVLVITLRGWQIQPGNVSYRK